MTAKAGTSLAELIDQLPAPEEGYYYVVKDSADESASLPEKTPNKNITFSVTLKAKEYNYTVNLDNGTTPTVTMVEYGGVLALPSEPIKKGHRFDGWKDSSGNAVTAGKTMPIGGFTLTATWTVKRYIITVIVDEEQTTKTLDYDAIITVEEPTKVGYTFSCWDGMPTGGKMPDSDLTLTAQWTPTVYNITYDLDGGTNDESNPANYTIESGAIAIADPTRAGYTFLGWTGTGLTGTVQSVTVAAGSTGDRSYTAVWQIITYNVTYTLGASLVTGDSAVNGTGNPTTYTVEDAFTLAIPTLTGYNFLGWTGTGLTDAVQTVTVAVGGTGDRSFTAVWERANYQLTFDTDGGDAVNSRQITYNDALGELPTPVKKPNLQKDEYAFYRWVATIDGTETEVTADMRMPLGGLTVKAQWYALSNLTFTAIDTTAYAVTMSATGDAAQVPDVVIPSSYGGKPVTTIGDGAFRRRTFIKSVRIPSSVTSIAASAFEGCSGLTSITIPEGVTSIGESAFNNCRGATSVTIPSSVTSIGENAFHNCVGLQYTTSNNVKYFGNEDNPYVVAMDAVSESITNAVINENCKVIYQAAFLNCSGLTTMTIPDSVTSIAASAFEGCSGLTSITIPEGVTSIGVAAFLNCSGLTSITIPEGVTSIGVAAFLNCSGLTSITIPEGVTSIGNSMFYGCVGLTTVIIPKTVANIDKNAFSGCDTLTKIYYTGTSADKIGLTINTTNNNAIQVDEKWYYYSEEAPEPTDTNQYWQYDTDGKTILEW